MTLWEICQSEFGIQRTEFFFRYTIPQLFLLVTSRSERNEESKDEKKEPVVASLSEMENFAYQFKQH